MYFLSLSLFINFPHQYARMDYKADIKKVNHLLSYIWKIPTPVLIFKVTSAKQTVGESKSVSKFKQNLINAAVSTGEWGFNGDFLEI